MEAVTEKHESCVISFQKHKEMQKGFGEHPAVHGRVHIAEQETVEHQCKSRSNEGMWCSSDTKSCTAAPVLELLFLIRVGMEPYCSAFGTKLIVLLRPTGCQVCLADFRCK